MELQIALDCLTTAEALAIARQVVDSVDFIEAGTPLIKSEGLGAVRLLKEQFPEKRVVADMKTMDTGFLEAEIAYQAGADIVTVLGIAPTETLQGTVRAARKYGKGIMIDSLGVRDFGDLLGRIEEVSVDYVLVHAGIDQQHAGRSPFADLKRIHERIGRTRLAVAGGLDKRSLAKIAGFPKVSLVVVGGAITRAVNPREAAASLKGALCEDGAADGA